MATLAWSSDQTRSASSTVPVIEQLCAFELTMKVIESTQTVVEPVKRTGRRRPQGIVRKIPQSKLYSVRIVSPIKDIEPLEFEFDSILPNGQIRGWLRDQGLIGCFDEVLREALKLQAHI